MKQHSKLDKVSDLEYMDAISSKIRITPKEVDEFADKVSVLASKRFMNLKK